MQCLLVFPSFNLLIAWTPKNTFTWCKSVRNNFVTVIQHFKDVVSYALVKGQLQQCLCKLYYRSYLHVFNTLLAYYITHVIRSFKLITRALF